MKRLIPLLFFLFGAFAIQAQVTISGSIFDEQNAPLPGAHISLLYPWGDAYKTTVSETNGQFEINEIDRGGYRLKVTFLGFKDLIREVTVKDKSLNTGRILLKDGVIELEGVVVKDKVPLATTLGDTTQYNADAFKTLPDASAEELLEKMPGVVVENGTVQAEGEDVKEVLVDGRPFFGNDPMAALRNLPAEVVDKIQVFDRSSDQSRFTGFDDGETTKTINIITKVKMRNGQFGKAYAGYGTEERYNVGGNLSLFNGNQRISVIGQMNNINQQNFSSEDLLGVVGSSGGRRGGGRRGGGRGGSRGGGGGSSANDFLVQQQGGIAQTNAIGLNYSDKWGKKVEVSGSYFFNQSDNNSIENSNREYIDSDEVNEIYKEDNQNNTDNNNHRFNLRLTYQIDSANSIIFRPRLSFQQNEGVSTTLGDWRRNSRLLSQTDNFYQSDLSGLDFSNNLLFRHRFAKNRRTFSVGLGTSYNNKEGQSLLQSEDEYFAPRPSLDTLDQQADLAIKGWNLSSNFSYTEPIGKRSMLMTTYRINWQQEESDRETFDFSEATQDYNQLNAPLSNVFNSDYLRHQLGAGINYRKDKLMLMARATFQWASLKSDQQFPTETSLNQTFYNFVPFAMMSYRKSRQENIRLMYRSNTTAPTVEQLQEVIDNSNPLQLSIGNSNLEPAVRHMLSARYSKNSIDKSSIFYAMFRASYTANHIGSNSFLNETNNPIFDQLELAQGEQLTQSVNLDGYWNVRFFTTYGVPITALKSNLNINLSTNYTRTPSRINDALNYSNNRTIGTGLVLSSNVSDKLDFTISWRPSYNHVSNSLRSEGDSKYYSQNSRFKLGWIIGSDIVFRTDVRHQYYNGLSESFNQNYWLWNMSLGKKLFKNKLGEISLSVFDLLDQNNSITRNINEVYIEDIRTNVLKRYIMLNFTYNFRNFNIGNKPYEAPKEGRRRPDFGRGF